MEALNKQALRILHLFGNDDVKCVRTSVGAEQEYFLIDKEMYDKRPDLRFTGRTLFGAKAPKGQEMDDHYFGQIKERIADYMSDLDGYYNSLQMGLPALFYDGRENPPHLEIWLEYFCKIILLLHIIYNTSFDG